MKIRALVKPYMRACVLGALLVPARAVCGAETGVWAQRWRDLWRRQTSRRSACSTPATMPPRQCVSVDPMRIGTAWYRAGEFERAAAAFGQLASAEGHFNRANALLMQGHYDEAIEAYGQALQQRPDWQLAIDNRDLAVARQARLAPPEDDAGGTGGKLEADEIVFDNTGRTNKVGNEQVTGGDTGLTDARDA